MADGTIRRLSSHSPLAISHGVGVPVLEAETLSMRRRRGLRIAPRACCDSCVAGCHFTPTERRTASCQHRLFFAQVEYCARSICGAGGRPGLARRRADSRAHFDDESAHPAADQRRYASHPRLDRQPDRGDASCNNTVCRNRTHRSSGSGHSDRPAHPSTPRRASKHTETLHGNGLAAARPRRCRRPSASPCSRQTTAPARRSSAA